MRHFVKYYTGQIMSIFASQYVDIRNILSGIECSSSKMEKLKKTFEHEINSTRTMEQINSVSELFTVLEKRLYLSPNHLDNLKLFIRIVSPENLTIERILQPEPDVDHHIPGLPHAVRESHKVIKRKIGHKWPDLAIQLGCQECEIEMFRMQYEVNKFDLMLDKILIPHYRKYSTNHDRWRSQLQKALRESRRVDISEDIDAILGLHPLH